MDKYEILDSSQKIELKEIHRLLQEKSNYLKQRHNNTLGGVVEKR